MWDVGGQDKLRPLWRSYTRCTDGIIFVVDSTRQERLEEAKLELLKICKTVHKQSQIPVLILANKQDLPVALDVDKLETMLGLKELGPTVPWHLQPTCAVTGNFLIYFFILSTTVILKDFFFLITFIEFSPFLKRFSSYFFCFIISKQFF